MKAIVYQKYGPPEVLQLKELPKPSPRDNEILVRVHATTVTIGDTIMRSLKIPGPRWQRLMSRVYLGIRKPKRTILGMELTGEVESVGDKVIRFKPGDLIFASTFAVNFGGYAEPALDDADRRAIGGIHPRFMGGEYLPDLRPGEVEIARITLASTLQDVTSVYARRGKRRIHYRIVNEYEGETLAGRTTRSYIRPLSLGELESFLNGAFDLFGILEMNFAEDGYDPDEVRAFATATSAFYPQLSELYARRIEEWVLECRAWYESYEDAESESEAGTPESSAG